MIESETGLRPEIVEGGRGEFTVWVGKTKVAEKDSSGFPSDDDAVAAVRDALRAP